MMTKKKRALANRHELLIDDLKNNFSIASEKELRRQLEMALARAKRRGVKLHVVRVRNSRGVVVELGESGSGRGDMTVGYWTDKRTWERPALRRLVKSAAAMLLMTHPILRRFV